MENQLAKAAWRTAGWLNAIAAEYLGLSLETEEEVVMIELPGSKVGGEHEFKLPGSPVVVQN